MHGVGASAGQGGDRRQESDGMGEVDLCGWVTASWHQVDAAKVFGSDESRGLVGLFACLFCCV